MTATPPQPYLRRGKALRWLESLGITRHQFEKALESGVIHPYRLAGVKSYFLTSELDTYFARPAREAALRAK